MRKLFLALIVGTIAQVHSTTGKVPTQEQLQTADAQLNQVYQQFRGTLNDTQKEQLKLDGNNWKQLDK